MAEDFRFEHSLGNCRVTYEDAPEYAVAQDEEFILRLCEESGLRLKGLRYGQWTGRADLSWQDIVVVESAN